MAAIEATEDEVTESIAGKEQELSIAAINGPASTVISGDRGSVEEVRRPVGGAGQKTKRLAVSHAFHSPLMEPMLEEFAEVAASLTYSEPKIPIVSNLTGEPLEPRAGHRPRLLGRARARAGALCRRDRDPEEQGSEHLPGARPRPGALRDGARVPWR